MEAEDRISGNLAENRRLMDRILRSEKSFDIVYRPVKAAGRQAGFYFVDGMVKDEIMEKLQEFFYHLKPEDLPDGTKDGQKTAKEDQESSGGGEQAPWTAIPYVEVDAADSPGELARAVLCGSVSLFVDGIREAYIIDCRTYPARSVQEPDKDKVLRGSRDGFVETVVFNTALIRRRIRDTDLVMEMLNAGESSKTDIVLCYMEGRADPALVEKLRSRINGLEVDALTMNQESLAECIYHGKWFNPFPKFKYTERPDAAAAGILEGKVAVLVDNSPSAMLLPATLFDIMEEADDFYFPPVTGTYLKISRFLIGMLTLFLTPLWLLLMQNPQWIPPSLEFIKVREAVNVPLILQLLILELSIDGLKLAAINTPSMLTTPLSVIAALVIGEFTVKSGWFNAETMLYMAFVSIANYMQASYELSYAFKFMRILLLLLTWAFQAWGLAAGVVLLCILVAGNKTVSGESYLYPLFPFDGRQLARRLLRRRISFEHMEKR